MLGSRAWDSAAVFGVVLTGPPGAGKTAALTALSDALIDDEIPHASADVDELAWAFPYPTLEERCAHLRTWCGPHRRAGHELVLVAEVIESPAQLRCVVAALGADEHLLVRLQAPVPMLRQRIAVREPPGWSGLARLQAEAEELFVSQPELDGVHLVLDTERLTPAQAADRIRAARPDRLLPPNPASPS
jgi:hypothetical protein